jgi:hypothetical protein
MRLALLTISAAMLPILGHAAPERQDFGQPEVTFSASDFAREAYDILQPSNVDATGSVITITYDDQWSSTSLNWRAPITSSTLLQSGADWQLSTVQTSGGLTVRADFLIGLTDGGEITWRDMEIDLVNGSISAVVSGSNGLDDAGRVTVASIGQVSKSLTVAPYNPNLCCMPTPHVYELGTFEVTLSELTLTDAGATTLMQGLGINSNSLGRPVVEMFKGTSLGDITLTEYYVAEAGTFVASVPEPSTWALTLLGLTGVAAAARARRHTA